MYVVVVVVVVDPGKVSVRVCGAYRISVMSPGC